MKTKIDVIISLYLYILVYTVYIFVEYPTARWTETSNQAN